ncbi:MAG: hypothetical protein LBT53_03215 [Puniceicoccales bacterium]|nr:hypothetical protein [Puniceicoccales bacterium]
MSGVRNPASCSGSPARRQTQDAGRQTQDAESGQRALAAPRHPALATRHPPPTTRHPPPATRCCLSPPRRYSPAGLTCAILFLASWRGGGQTRRPVFPTCNFSPKDFP